MRAALGVQNFLSLHPTASSAAKLFGLQTRRAMLGCAIPAPPIGLVFTFSLKALSMHCQAATMLDSGAKTDAQMQVVPFVPRLRLAVRMNVVVHLEHARVDCRGHLLHELGRYDFLHGTVEGGIGGLMLT